MKLLPQEVEVWYVLPAIRKEFTTIMRNQGFKQKDIAKVLGVTEAAISQYKNSKRACLVELSPSIKQEIANISLQIKQECKLDVDGNSAVECKYYEGIYSDFQKLLRIARQEKLICSLHKSLTVMNEDCTICSQNVL
jgi:predicted transcriptional regulator